MQQSCVLVSVIFIKVLIPRLTYLGFHTFANVFEVAAHTPHHRPAATGACGDEVLKSMIVSSENTKYKLINTLFKLHLNILFC